jgi:hypothetical protein
MFIQNAAPVLKNLPSRSAVSAPLCPSYHSAASGITPEMVQAVSAILFDWDHGEWELPERGLENFYDTLARQIIRRMLVEMSLRNVQ